MRLSRGGSSSSIVGAGPTFFRCRDSSIGFASRGLLYAKKPRPRSKSALLWTPRSLTIWTAERDEPPPEGPEPRGPSQMPGSGPAHGWGRRTAFRCKSALQGVTSRAQVLLFSTVSTGGGRKPAHIQMHWPRTMMYAPPPQTSQHLGAATEEVVVSVSCTVPTVKPTAKAAVKLRTATWSTRFMGG